MSCVKSVSYPTFSSFSLLIHLSLPFHFMFQQLLCLVLQILATLALDPSHHKALLDAGVAEALPPLLLPADEFFYTNHTTLFARYVKHHAARLLVYLGLHHRSALRVSVFDLVTMGKKKILNSPKFV